MRDGDITTDPARQYHRDFAAPFVRARLPGSPADDDAAIRLGLEACLPLYRFKRTAGLPRVRKVLGILRGLAPDSLLDLGSGRGVFLCPCSKPSPPCPSSPATATAAASPTCRPSPRAACPACCRCNSTPTACPSPTAA